MLNLNRFSLKIILYTWNEAILNFFICTYKIMCKPMGNFAENLNLGNRVRPPWCRWRQKRIVQMTLKSGPLISIHSVGCFLSFLLFICLFVVCLLACLFFDLALCAPATSSKNGLKSEKSKDLHLPTLQVQFLLTDMINNINMLKVVFISNTEYH